MKTFRKALTAGAVALAGGLALALGDGNLTLPELLIALGAGLAGGAATYRVPNEPA